MKDIKKYDPCPGPGVGGYCLSKDPYLYASIDNQSSYGQLSRLGRAVNNEAELYPLKIVSRYAERLDIPFEKLAILIVGVLLRVHQQQTTLDIHHRL